MSIFGPFYLISDVDNSLVATIDGEKLIIKYMTKPVYLAELTYEKKEGEVIIKNIPEAYIDDFKGAGQLLLYCLLKMETSAETINAALIGPIQKTRTFYLKCGFRPAYEEEIMDSQFRTYIKKAESGDALYKNFIESFERYYLLSKFPSEKAAWYSFYKEELIDKNAEAFSTNSLIYKDSNLGEKWVSNRSRIMNKVRVNFNRYYKMGSPIIYVTPPPTP